VANGNLNPNTDADANLLPLTETVYSAKDQPTLYDAILRRLRERFEGDYNDMAETAAAIMMVHVQSYGAGQLAFHIDRSAADTFLSTSRTLAAATRHTEQMNYKIPPATAAGGEFVCTVGSPTAQQAIVAKGHRFQVEGGLIFEASDQVIVPQGATSFTVSVSEGTTFERLFVADGEPSREYPLAGVGEDQYLAADPLRVHVDGNLWAEVDFFEFAQTNQYEIQYTSAPPLVRFGDGFAGNVPVDNAAINVSYRVISGETGNISAVTDEATTTITSVDPFLVAGTAVQVVVTAPNGTAGGEPPMPLERVKVLAPKAVAARGAAVTKEDYRALVNSFSDPTHGKVAQGYAARVGSTQADTVTVGFLTSIGDAVSNHAASASTSATAHATARTTAEADVAAIEAESGSGNVLALLSTDVNARSVSVATQAQTIAGASATIDSAAVNHGLKVTALTNYINDNLSGDVGALALVGELNALMATDVVTANGTVNASTATLQADATVLAESSTAIETSRVSIETARVDIPTQLTAMQSEIDSINTDAAATETSVTADIAALFLHLDTLFDSDCSANVVNVPILALGADGFYTGPSQGLVSALQVYLDEIKEVTQHVNVISGVGGLLKLAMTITGVYSSAYTRSEVRAAIESRIDDLLKGREFGDPLYLSAPDRKSGVYDTLAKISGLESVNVTITAPEDRIDSLGNVIPQELEVITKLQDGISITVEAQTQA
jgi:hypothetical protein